MNPLINAEIGMLYTTDSRFLAKIKYTRNPDSYAYPDRVNHKKMHEGFKKTVKEINERLEKEGSSVALVGKINSDVAGWLINHIKKQDVKVAKHIEENS